MAPAIHPPDQAAREAAIRELERNVLIDAGAGTGKTTTLVARMVEMLAPTSGSPPVSISRIAAVTFTRRAAGELRLRIREKVLAELARRDLDERRRGLLREALAGLDTAYVGTIHGFADRLLRQRPKEARLSPSYEIAEDPGALVVETFTLLLEAARSGRLAAELAGTEAEERAREAERTVHDAIEYPVVGRREEEGTMLLGYVDLVAAASEEYLDVIDFKTYRPPEGPVDAVYPEYVRQVRPYGELLEAARINGGRKIRCGLLFTDEGRITWLK